MWQYSGQKRPDFADTPGPGQESVWDYPRPPELVPDGRLIEVFSGEQLVVSSKRAYRVLETAHPPSFYIPPEDVTWEMLTSFPGNSVCEWKGTATYWALAKDPKHHVVGWSYPKPTPAFVSIRDYVSFYPVRLACYVAGERVRAQPGKFYGGWVTGEIAGPFKGQPGSAHW
ncbi:hypothetical protein D1AOALGA4SA_9034 [Olavius algarvensis Delta 1 endosymbiont]|nr:hypothetical protein D1AOALGA4SA_9034 [Olavius algarvensis Delta 1 endosymbiont]